MNKLGLVFPTDESKSHWMTERMIRRAGLQNDVIPRFVVGSNLLAELRLSGVHTVVAFGEESLQHLLNKFDILRWFNRTVTLELNHGPITVIPCLEPRLLLPRKSEEDEHGKKRKGMRHPPRYQGAVVELLKRAFVGNFPSKLPVDYWCDPSPEKFTEWVDEFYQKVGPEDVFLSWDIETPYKMKERDEEELDEELRSLDTTILRVSFCYKPGHAVSVPWTSRYLDQIKRLMNYKGMHLTWNGLAFDCPIVKKASVHIAGFVLDGMDAFHLYQTDLDKGLEHVTSFFTDILPWKHLSDSEPARYSCIDADAALRNWLGIGEQLGQRGLLDRFYREMELMNVLDEATQRGNNVNNEFRLMLKNKWEKELNQLLIASQTLVEEKFLRVKYLRRLPKNADSTWQMKMLPVKKTVCTLCGKLNVTVKHKCEKGEGWEKKRIVAEAEHYFKRPQYDTLETLEQTNAYLKQSGFNPCSSYQMLKYMKVNKHPVGYNHKTEQDMADTKHLQKLVKKYDKTHPIYRHTIRVKQIQKALSTYVNGLEPDTNNRVHSHYVNSPSTWRLGSRNFNAQNLGKRENNPYAREARKIIVPSPGCVLVEADSSSIESVFTGYEMRDQRFIEIARKGVHSYICCKWLKWPFDDEHISKIKDHNKELYHRVKRVVHGTSYGMTPYLMHMNEPDTFPTLGDAKTMQQFLFKEMPGLGPWHRELQLFAQKNGYLENAWKLRHQFYDVFTYKHDDEGNLIMDENNQPKIVLGKDGKRVIAFKPQSSGGFFMRDNLLRLSKTEARPWMPAVISIHDGYCLDVPEGKVEVAKRILGDILTRPIEEMQGLRVGCEISVSLPFSEGGNFLDLKTVDKLLVEA